MSELIVITYKGSDTGFQVLEKLGQLQKQSLIELEDAAVVVKNEKGKVKVKQTLENKHTGAVATWGGFWGLLIGLLFGGPIFWGIFGALLGAVLGKTTDLGIDNKFIKEVGNSLDTGDSAIFMLIYDATADKVVPQLAEFEGTVFQTSLSNEDEQALKDALSHDKVAQAVEDSHELEEASAE